MKTLTLLAGILLAAIGASAQSTQVEIDFEKNRAAYTREHFSEGEDASSGYDYLFYKRGAGIVKIRSIWSATHSKELRIEDMYFEGDDIVLIRKFTGGKRLLNTLKNGRAAQLNQKEDFHFDKGKLTKWIEGSVAKPVSDSRWAEMETAMREHARSLRDYYKSLKEDNR